ncbi:MAG: GNAT family N-acetyltransferase [Chloroflexi bacterium]|nr:GNAT family N-acetyltransferase [Chloroflexota bacterium]
MAEPGRGAKLDDEVLARRARLPLRVAPVTLVGSLVRLAPLDLERDVHALHAVSNGQPATLGDRQVGAYDAESVIWRYMAGGPFGRAEELAAWLQAQVDAPNGLCLCVFDAPTGRPIGVATFMSNVPEHLKVELGSIWYSPLAQRMGANTEATYLMLRHAFELGYRRVEWKCDALNQRSRRAALRMGFTCEGIQECHYIVKGRNRDTAWFRILDREWPAVKGLLERLLDRS